MKWVKGKNLTFNEHGVKYGMPILVILQDPIGRCLKFSSKAKAEAFIEANYEALHDFGGTLDEYDQDDEILIIPEKETV